jgi:hypothetical protein
MRPILAFALVLVAAPLFAWTPGATERMARKSSNLAPPDMRMLIDRYSADFHHGLAFSAVEESRHAFLVDARRGSLRGDIHSEVRAAIEGIRKQEALSTVVERLGRIAHLVADANNPFAVANSSPRLADSRVDFEQYLERKQTTFPTVFYGLQSGMKLEPYIDAALIRSSSLYPLLDEEYFRFGQRRTSAEFDDRSTAFGVAAISYSHAVTDIVNVYYYIWKEAGGDVRSARALERGNLLLTQ